MWWKLSPLSKKKKEKKKGPAEKWDEQTDSSAEKYGGWEERKRKRHLNSLVQHKVHQLKSKKDEFRQLKNQTDDWEEREKKVVFISEMKKKSNQLLESRNGNKVEWKERKEGAANFQKKK